MASKSKKRRQVTLLSRRAIKMIWSIDRQRSFTLKRGARQQQPAVKRERKKSFGKVNRGNVSQLASSNAEEMKKIYLN